MSTESLPTKYYRWLCLLSLYWTLPFWQQNSSSPRRHARHRWPPCLNFQRDMISKWCLALSYDAMRCVLILRGKSVGRFENIWWDVRSGHPSSWNPHCVNSLVASTSIVYLLTMWPRRTYTFAYLVSITNRKRCGWVDGRMAKVG